MKIKNDKQDNEIFTNEEDYDMLELKKKKLKKKKYIIRI